MQRADERNQELDLQCGRYCGLAEVKGRTGTLSCHHESSCPCGCRLATGARSAKGKEAKTFSERKVQMSYTNSTIKKAQVLRPSWGKGYEDEGLLQSEGPWSGN